LIVIKNICKNSPSVMQLKGKQLNN